MQRALSHARETLECFGFPGELQTVFTQTGDEQGQKTGPLNFGGPGKCALNRVET
jgi:hypothetical protein